MTSQYHTLIDANQTMQPMGCYQWGILTILGQGRRAKPHAPQFAHKRELLSLPW